MVLILPMLTLLGALRLRRRAATAAPRQVTGEEMVRHTLRKADGSIFAPAHFRPNWK